MKNVKTAMTKALRINVDPYVLELAKTVYFGDKKGFRDLEFWQQELLMESQLHLEGLATEEEKRAFEIEKRLKESENTKERLFAHTRRLIHNATRTAEV